MTWLFSLFIRAGKFQMRSSPFLNQDLNTSSPAIFFGRETLSDGKLQQHFSFGIEYFHLKYVLLLFNHHYRCTFHAITATDNHREVIAKAAFGMIGIFMCMRVKADIERCFLQKFTPKPGTQILVVVSVKRNVMNQNPLSGFLKFFGSELTLQKSYLVITQLRKVVESVVYPMIIRLHNRR